MQPAERLPCRLVVALESHIRGDFVTDFAEADFCAEYRVIHPQTSFIHARRPRLRPQIGQGAKSGKGATTAFATLLSIFSIASTYSIRLSRNAWPYSLTTSTPCDFM